MREPIESLPEVGTVGDAASRIELGGGKGRPWNGTIELTPLGTRPLGRRVEGGTCRWRFLGNGGGPLALTPSALYADQALWTREAARRIELFMLGV